MKRYRLNEKQAESIIRCWLANGIAAAADLSELFPTLPYRLRIKPWLRVNCKAASDYLWDGQPNKAYEFLLKNGLQSEKADPIYNSAGYTRKQLQAQTITYLAVEEMKRRSNVGPVARIRRRVK